MNARFHGGVALAWLALALVSPAGARDEDSGATHEYYADLRAFYFEDLDPVGAPGPDSYTVRGRLGLRYNRAFSDRWLIDFDARAVGLYRERGNGEDFTEAFIELKRLYLRGEELFDNHFLSADLGRRRLKESTGWLYDFDMDLAELAWDSTLLDVRIGMAAQLWDGLLGADQSARDVDQEIDATDSAYLYAELVYQWYYQNYVGVWLVHEQLDEIAAPLGRRIRDPEDATLDGELTWLALRARGSYRHDGFQLDYWGDAALVSGDRELALIDADGRVVEGRLHQDIDDALGLELGAIARFRDNRYALGLGWARGQGGGPQDPYLQPRIATNKSAVLGLERYRRYGEVLAPRLSNLKVGSVWAGLALTPNTWLEAAFHDYRQRHAQPLLSTSRVGLAPNGVSTDIGTELDLVYGGRLRNDLDVSIIVGGFFPGDAFEGVAGDDTALRLTFEINARF